MTMPADFTAPRHRSARAVVAAWLIAVELLLTASVGATFCGIGSVGEAPLRSAPLSSENYAAAATAAADNAAIAGGVQLGAAVLDTLTGELSLGGGGTLPMVSASLSKLIVVVDIVDRRRDGLVVEARDLTLIRRALGPSDDLAMDELWSRFDGQGAIARVVSRLGLAGTVGPDDPSIWGEMTITAADMAQLYRHVLAMPQPDRELILDALAAAPPVAADGFAQDFGLLSPRSRGPAIAKQGWVCCWDQAGYLHSAGVVGDAERFVVVLLSRQPFQPDSQHARDRLTTVAVAATDPLARAGSFGS